MVTEVVYLRIICCHLIIFTSICALLYYLGLHDVKFQKYNAFHRSTDVIVTVNA